MKELGAGSGELGDAMFGFAPSSELPAPSFSPRDLRFDELRE
jgi:hypothetical protein